MTNDEIIEMAREFANLVAKKALETKNEPVPWEQFYPDIGKPQIAFNAEVVGYVAPQRTWVDLTNKEMKAIVKAHKVILTGKMWVFIADLIDKLKEKNT